MDGVPPEGPAQGAGQSPFGTHFPLADLGGGTGILTLEVHNTWISILNPHPYGLDLIDHETRYPTETALALARGFRAPDQHPCSACQATGLVNGTFCEGCRGTGLTSGWDGWIRLLHRTKTKPPYFPAGLLYRATNVLQANQVPFTVVDRRERPVEGFPEAADLQLRDYQVAAADLALKQGRGVLDMPPRSGKTRTMAEIVRRLGLKTIWMAPTDRIVQQTHEFLDGAVGPHYCHRQTGVAGWEVAANHNVVVCTASTAAMLPAEFYRSREVLVVDEIHHASAKSYGEIAKMCDHVYYRFGMTGTFFRSGPDLLALHGFLSDVIYRITSVELERRGHLVPTKVVFLPVLSGPLKGVPRSSTYQQGIGKLGIQEHEYRQQLAANCAAYLDKSGRRVLCLVATKRQGRDLAERIGPLIKKAPTGAQFKAVEFVSTDTERSTLNKILDSFINHQEVRVLIGTSLLGEGVDLPGADALVYARGEKAEVSLTQNAYRVCTAAEGKGAAVIVDFADRHHPKLLAHSQERLAVYYDEPIFSCEVLADPADFPGWAQRAGLIRL